MATSGPKREVFTASSQSPQAAFCQICQLPFKLMRVSTPASHIVKCRRSVVAPKRECQDGVRCLSAMESHYQFYSHEVLRKHRSSGNGESTPDSTHGMFSYLHGRDLKSTIKFCPNGKKKRVKEFNETIVDLTESQSSEEFRSTQSSTKSFASRNSDKKVKASPLVTSNHTNVTPTSSPTILGKHKPNPNNHVKHSKSKRSKLASQAVPSQSRKVGHTSQKSPLIKIENPWTITSTRKNEPTPQKSSKKTENLPILQKQNKKKTPKKNRLIKIEKPMTENPWTITASQIEKFRSPVKILRVNSGGTPVDIIDLTTLEPNTSRPTRLPQTTLGEKLQPNNSTRLPPKNLFPSFCDKKSCNINGGKTSCMKLTPSSAEEKSEKNTNCRQTRQSARDGKHTTSITSKLGSPHKSGEFTGADGIDLSKVPFIKLERLSLDLISSPLKSFNHDKTDNLLNNISNHDNVHLESTQILKTAEKSYASLATTLDTQDSEEWSLPLSRGRGPGFAPLSPINIDRSSHFSPRELFIDCKKESFINNERAESSKTLTIDKKIDKNANIVQNQSEHRTSLNSNLNHENEKFNANLSSNSVSKESKSEVTTKKTFNVHGLCETYASKQCTNGSDIGSDTTLGNDSDVMDDDDLDCSMLLGLSQSKTLPFSMFNNPQSDPGHKTSQKINGNAVKCGQNENKNCACSEKSSKCLQNMINCFKTCTTEKNSEPFVNLPRNGDLLDMNIEKTETAGDNNCAYTSQQSSLKSNENLCNGEYATTNYHRFVENHGINGFLSNSFKPPLNKQSAVDSSDGNGGTSSSIRQQNKTKILCNGVNQYGAAKCRGVNGNSSTSGQNTLTKIFHDDVNRSSEKFAGVESRVVNGGSSTNRQDTETKYLSTGVHVNSSAEKHTAVKRIVNNDVTSASKQTPDKYANVKSWLNSASKPRKQGDIGSMLFGLEAKVKVEPIQNDALNGYLKNGKKEKNNRGFFGGNRQRTCPFYKKVSGTDIAVDAFSYGVVEGIQFYFLSHFHADHYMGLTKKHWKHKIFCSQVTGNLVSQKIGLPKDLIVCLPMWTEIEVGNVKVLLLEANHCPGAVLFAFKLCNNKVILHTGDFRATKDMERYTAFQGVRIDTLYLDTTYLNPDYQFPLQRDVINTAISIATDEVIKCKKTLFVVGTYLIGKERIFTAISKAIKSQVFVAADKYRTIQCLEDKDLKSMVTRNPSGARVHVLPMRQLNVQDLKVRLSQHKEFDQLVAIKPTGWTHDKKQPALNLIKPVISGQIKIYGLPYSEHSSFEDLRRFVKYLRPSKIIPTVNVGKKEARDKMTKYLDKWKVGLDP